MKAQRSLIYLLSLASLLTLNACQSESSTLVPAPVDYGVAQGQLDGVKIDLNPKVDILFVIDDSGSMKAHQANLARNIDRFVDGFGKSSIIDFHIGVTTIYDSIRYGEVDIPTAKIIRPGVVAPVAQTGQRNFSPLGELRPLKAPDNKITALAEQKGRFVTAGTDYTEILRETLKVGVANYVGKTKTKEIPIDKAKPELGKQSVLVEEASGPEYEELFSPVVAALSEPVRSAANKGFLRDDAHLVVIFVTDANDASIYSADQMYRFLVDAKGGRDHFTVFGVINPSEQPESASCSRDPSGKPYKLEDLIRKSGGMALNMCTDYSAKLAEVGRMVRDRTVGVIRHYVERLPVVDSIRVTYGQQEIPAGTWNGWSYDANEKVIIIRGAAHWAFQPGAKIGIAYEPVNPARQSSHCIGCAPGN